MVWTHQDLCFVTWYTLCVLWFMFSRKWSFNWYVVHNIAVGDVSFKCSMTQMLKYTDRVCNSIAYLGTKHTPSSIHKDDMWTPKKRATR